jgi:alpha/beta hydrolase fold
MSRSKSSFPHTCVQGSVDDMVEDVTNGIGWVISHAARNGADPEQVYVMGQSCGGHLAALALLRQCSPKLQQRRRSSASLPLSINGSVISAGDHASNGSSTDSLVNGGAQERKRWLWRSSTRRISRRMEWGPENIKVRRVLSS